MDVCFEISDRYREELGPWPLAVGDAARALLYVARDHSPEQHGGRLLLPDMALASAGSPFVLRRVGPLLTAFCGMIGALRTFRIEGRERRDETTIRLECGVPIALVLQTRRWDNVDLAPAVVPGGLPAWQLARPGRVADLVSGTFELGEAAFEAGGVSSFPLLEDGAPDYPVRGEVLRLERLDLDPGSLTFGTVADLDRLSADPFWPHRYFVTLRA